MAMNDDSMVKIMETLGLDYGPAERATKAFESRIASLNQQLFQLKANALKGAGDINKMFSSQLGGISGSKMILDQYGQPLKVLNDNIASSFGKATEAAKKHGHAVHGVAQEYNILGSEFQRRAQWFLTGTLFYGTIKAATETIQTISEVEMGVTQIARVMEDSTFVFKDYRDELLQLGVDYGQTFDTVQDIALRWAQAGYNVKDSLENTKTSLLALNVAELNAENATASMIGIMSQWQLTAKDLPLVLDKINKTADDFTVTSQDLVDGLLRSSGAAKIMGLSIDQTISLLTVMREASGRTGREVGNALNSILSYVQRPGSIKTLEGLGIQVFADAAKTQFRNVMLIFQDVASRWDTLAPAIQDGFVKAADDAGLYSEELASAIGTQQEWNDLQQRDISQAAAGVYRRNYFIGMIERLSGAQEVLNGMTDAAGYSQAENARTMETLEKKYTSLKAAMQEVAVALGDAGLLDALKSITDVAKDAADGFADLDDETKVLILTVLELMAALGAIKGVAGLLTARNLIFGAESVLALIGPWGQLAVAITAVVGALGLLVYNSSRASAQSIQDSLNNVNAKKSEVDESNKLIQKYDELAGRAVQSNEVKAEMLDIQRQLASIYPGYVDGLDNEGNKIITNIPLLREMNALKQQEIDLKRQQILLDANTRLPQLQADQKVLQERIDKNKARLASGDTTSTFTWRGQTTKTDTSEQIRKNLISDLEKLSTSELEEQMMKSVLDTLSAGAYNPSTDTLSGKDLRSRLASGGNVSDDMVTLYKDGEKKQVKKSEVAAYLAQGWSTTPPSGGPEGSYSNEPLQNELRRIQYRKNMTEATQESMKQEIADLKIIRDTYSMNGDERMDIEERIYNAEKALRDKTLQDSINWINEKKALGELSAEQEIAAWNRVKENQKGNIEAVKEATQNLYRLQKELRENEVQENKDSLKDLQDSIKDSYDEQIDLIEKKSEAKVKAIDDELEALDRQESGYDYDTKMADLEEQEAYWSVRTGEEARQNLADIRKQIAEAEHDREVELQKQGLEDEKDAIEDAADAEKAKWEAAYKDMEKAFSDHNLDIIAQAATYSKEAYQQWYDNYIMPMQQALKNGDVEGFGNTVGGIGGSISSLPSHDWGMTHEDYTQFIANGKAWYSASEADKALLQAQNDALRVKYGRDPSAGEYPQFHTGGQSLSEGWAKVLPGELFFPASLSTDLKTLIAVSSGITGKVAGNSNISTTDNRKEVKIGTLLSVENMNIEDEMDGEILSRQLYRAALNLI
jgi:TP901 family phage tail tape measure protein